MDPSVVWTIAIGGPILLMAWGAHVVGKTREENEARLERGRALARHAEGEGDYEAVGGYDAPGDGFDSDGDGFDD